ncbi:MAG: hypothetical protein ABSA40_00645 [Candidatus Dormibacteria bacterium]|jgi:hypothetical protein
MRRAGKVLTVVVMLGLMAAFGVGVNRYLAGRTSKAFAPAKKPTQEVIAQKAVLPGVVYFADGGGLFALDGTRVIQLQPQGQGWMQPALLPGGTGLLAVKEVPNLYSDLYELNLNGSIRTQLSQDAASAAQNNIDLTSNNWIFYPTVGPDGDVYFSYDWPKEPNDSNPYQVDLAVWKSPLGSTIDRAEAGKTMTEVSGPDWYTGGDVSPVPLPGGHLLYVKYEEASAAGEGSTPIPGALPGQEVSQIRLDPTVTTDGTPLTTPAENCSEPALNPAGTMIAMICSPSSTEADLVLASFSVTAGVGPLTYVVSGTLAASPAWSPSGDDLLYLAPSSNSGNGYFQLWHISGVNTGILSKPTMVTTDLDLDATSAPAWAAG